MEFAIKNAHTGLTETQAALKPTGGLLLAALFLLCSHATAATTDAADQIGRFSDSSKAYGWPASATNSHPFKKKRKDYTFWYQFNEKPSIIPGCPESSSYMIYGAGGTGRDAGSSGAN